MKWISIVDSSVQIQKDVPHLVWVNQRIFGENAERIQGHPQVAYLNTSDQKYFGEWVWTEPLEGYIIDNVTHYAEIERPE